MDDILNVLMRSMQIMRRRNEQVFQKHGSLPSHGLSVARMRLLGELAFHGPLRMNELAYEMGVTPRTMTTMVDALDREGLVARRPDPNDRRAVVVMLTDAGAALGFGEFTEMMRRAFEEMFAPLDEEERRQLYRILLKLTVAWEAEGGPKDAPADPDQSVNGRPVRGRGRARGRPPAPEESDADGRPHRLVGRFRFSREEPIERVDQPDAANTPGAPDDRPRGRGRRRQEGSG